MGSKSNYAENCCFANSLQKLKIRHYNEFLYNSWLIYRQNAKHRSKRLKSALNLMFEYKKQLPFCL